MTLFPADAGWAASGKLQGTSEVNGMQHRSAFYLDIDRLIWLMSCIDYSEFKTKVEQGLIKHSRKVVLEHLRYVQIYFTFASIAPCPWL